MTRDELREKVARVLCREVMGVEYDVISESATYLERKTNPESAILDKQEAKEIADLVLDTIFTALKEPTEEMSDAGSKSDVLSNAIIDWQGNYTPKEDVASDIWDLMLSSSALAPKEE